jgi:hypothetical protein
MERRAEDDVGTEPGRPPVRIEQLGPEVFQAYPWLVEYLGPDIVIDLDFLKVRAAMREMVKSAKFLLERAPYMPATEAMFRNLARELELARNAEDGFERYRLRALGCGVVIDGRCMGIDTLQFQDFVDDKARNAWRKFAAYLKRDWPICKEVRLDDPYFNERGNEHELMLELLRNCRRHDSFQFRMRKPEDTREEYPYLCLNSIRLYLFQASNPPKTWEQEMRAKYEKVLKDKIILKVCCARGVTVQIRKLPPPRPVPMPMLERGKNAEKIDRLERAIDTLKKEDEGRNRSQRRFPEEDYDMGYLIHAVSPKALKVTSEEVVPFPSEWSLLDHFATQKLNILNTLCSVDLGLRDYLKAWRKNNFFGGNDTLIQCTLALDATGARYDPIAARTPGDPASSKSCFAFLMLPMNAELKDLVLNVIAHVTGRIDPRVHERTDALARDLRLCGFKIWQRATDGDSGMNLSHRNFFKTYADLGDDLDLVVTTLMEQGDGEPDENPVPDLFHITKNARSRIAMAGGIPLALFAESLGITVEQLAKLCPDNPGITKNTPLSLLDDSLAVQAFKRDSLIAVGEADNVTGVLFLAPFVALMESVRFENMTIETRLLFLSIAFACFKKMLSCIKQTEDDSKGTARNKPKGKNKKEKPRIWQRKGAGVDKLTLWSKDMCIRGCNLCVTLYWAIKQWLKMGRPYPLALARIGTHSVECFFGMIRSILRGETRFKKFLAATVKAILCRQIMQKRCVKQFKQRFRNEAGCNLAPGSGPLSFDDLEVQIPPKEHPPPVAPDLGDLSEEDGKKVLEEELRELRRVHIPEEVFLDARSDISTIGVKIQQQEKAHREGNLATRFCANIVRPFAMLKEQAEELGLHDKSQCASPTRGLAVLARFVLLAKEEKEKREKGDLENIRNLVLHLAEQ